MNSDPDDALHWEGDEQAPVTSEPALPKGWNAVGKGSESVGVIEEDGTITPADAPEQMSSAMLLTTGIVGGVYLLYTVGWVIGGLRLQSVAILLVSDHAYVPMFWVAVLAPALWFLTSWVLTRGHKSWMRLVALIAGIAVLVPWPFVMFGSLGGGL